MTRFIEQKVRSLDAEAAPEVVNARSNLWPTSCQPDIHDGSYWRRGTERDETENKKRCVQIGTKKKKGKICRESNFDCATWSADKLLPRIARIAFQTARGNKPLVFRVAYVLHPLYSLYKSGRLSRLFASYRRTRKTVHTNKDPRTDNSQRDYPQQEE